MNQSSPSSSLSLIITASLTRLRHLIATSNCGDFGDCGGGDYEELESDDGSSANRLFSKPFLILYLVLNMALVIGSLGVLGLSWRERPSSPLRVWICGYVLGCVLQVGLVWREIDSRWSGSGGGGDDGVWWWASCGGGSSTLIKLETANSMASSLWWVVGFYWVCTGGHALEQESPRLYWHAVVLLAFDVIIVALVTGIIFAICLALFCCIPIIAIAYAMTIREGATEDDIKLLPKYKFRQSYACRKISFWELNQEARQDIESGTISSMSELSFYPEDSECCICLAQYVEGAELCTLPCNHHFHFGCISRWLRINATCPLCKFNILRCDTLV
ncbi:E3 ubiquitin-protein ligase-like protein [Drosera capensis]